MTGFVWSELSHFAAFMIGTLFGIILTVRLAKTLAVFLRRERDE